VRDVSEHGTEEDDPVDARRRERVGDLAREGLPAARGLGPQKHVDAGTAVERTPERHARPLEGAVAVFVEHRTRTVELVVEVVLRFEVRDRYQFELVTERPGGTACRFARIVPALEGDHEE
jgi:hypothetical protein